MATTPSGIKSVEVREVQEQFERWRSGRKTRERIPSKLWGMAAKLCETYSLHRIAQCLRLNYTALKVEVDRRLHPPHRKVAVTSKPTFVEYRLASGAVPGHSSGEAATALASTGAPVVEYVVEAPDSGKGMPRILVRGASAMEVAALVRALRDNGTAA